MLISAKAEPIDVVGNGAIDFSPTIASNIWDVLLKQNIPMYDVTEDIVIDWIDLNNNVEYSYSPKDSVFMITYLIPYSSDSQNRRNRLKERLNLKQ